jgi:predicted choloylglycine hydrolase
MAARGKDGGIFARGEEGRVGARGMPGRKTKGGTSTVWARIRSQLALLPERPAAGGARPLPGGESLAFESLREPLPGERWQGAFKRFWPAYRSWYVREGEAARPPLERGRQMLAIHMPELLGTYERLVELAGGDPLAARFLTMWGLPAFVVGCSQAAWTSAPSPMLARNYDYPPSRAEGIVYCSAWTGRQVIGMSDCLWGLLDGINDAGLAASLTFGGRPVVGEGFGIPLVIRYVLELCETVAEACQALARLPVHTAHNVTLLDRSGACATALLGPDREAEFRPLPAATNHQRDDDWPAYAEAVRSFERQRVLLALLASRELSRERFLESFLQPPLYSERHAAGFGTLYTAAYFPAEGRARYLWPDAACELSFERFAELRHTRVYAEPAQAA